jgi:hypothetical protein
MSALISERSVFVLNVCQRKLAEIRIHQTIKSAQYLRSTLITRP